MSSVYLNKNLLKLLNINNKLYTYNDIELIVKNTILSYKMIKNIFPKFKGCNCSNINCESTIQLFILYIKKELVISNELPECNYYYESNQKPIMINDKNFTFE